MFSHHTILETCILVNIHSGDSLGLVYIQGSCLIHIFLPSQERVPFAVVGSNMILEANGKRVRGRQYPWGIAEGQ